MNEEKEKRNREVEEKETQGTKKRRESGRGEGGEGRGGQPQHSPANILFTQSFEKRLNAALRTQV